jgi:hypothetical protein
LGRISGHGRGGLERDLPHLLEVVEGSLEGVEAAAKGGQVVGHGGSVATGWEIVEYV